MLNEVVQNSVRFVVLVLLQVLLLNNIRIGGLINPYIYVLFILALPLETSRGLMLILGFAVGLAVDFFTRTIGMHTFAAVAIAYARPILLRLIEPREGYELGMRPTVKEFGFTWYLTYAGILIVVHHFCLFTIESFRLVEIGYTLLKTIMSSAYTLVLILIIQYLSVRRRIIE